MLASCPASILNHISPLCGIHLDSFSVDYALVAEQLFASGCHFLVSMTSAGQLRTLRPLPYFVLIERALRDEGTSHHYQPSAEFSTAPTGILSLMAGAFDGLRVVQVAPRSTSTDAPFRETVEAVEAMRSRGWLAVEMEAAALYAFATARETPALCFAHLTNKMAQVHGDFNFKPTLVKRCTRRLNLKARAAAERAPLLGIAERVAHTAHGGGTGHTPAVSPACTGQRSSRTRH